MWPFYDVVARAELIHRHTELDSLHVTRGPSSEAEGIVMVLNVTILDSSITQPCFVGSLTPAGRPVWPICLVFSYRCLQAALHVGYDDDDETKRQPFISSNGARLFNDTVAARSRPELDEDGEPQ